MGASIHNAFAGYTPLAVVREHRVGIRPDASRQGEDQHVYHTRTPNDRGDAGRGQRCLVRRCGNEERPAPRLRGGRPVRLPGPRGVEAVYPATNRRRRLVASGSVTGSMTTCVTGREPSDVEPASRRFTRQGATGSSSTAPSPPTPGTT